MDSGVLTNLTMTFDREGNGAQFRASGWSNPEPAHCWTLGGASQLLLPPMQAGQASIMTFDIAPYFDGTPDMEAPLELILNGESLGRLTLKPGFETHRVIAPAGLMSDVALNSLKLIHPRHKPAYLEGNADTREVALAVRKVCVETLDFELYPTPIPLPAAPQPSLAGQSELVMKFESLGQNCEFGMFQRRCGAEPLGLLRFASTGLARVVHGIENNFDGIGDPEKLHIALGQGGKEYMGHHDVYGLDYHTFRSAGDVDLEKFTLTESKRLGFLARILMEDIGEAAKVFVVQRTPPLTLGDVVMLFTLLRARNADNKLLWVAAVEPGADDLAGRAERLGPGLFRGYLDRLAPIENVPDLSFDCWLRVCSAVEAGIGQP